MRNLKIWRRQRLNKSILRPTYAGINTDNFIHNVFQIKKHLARGIKIIGVVKADAYGHGAQCITSVAGLAGIDYLGVALIEEGQELRRLGTRLPIIVLGSTYPLENFHQVIKSRLIPTISSLAQAQELSAIARKHNTRVPVHIKIDTGMGRIGLWWESAGKFITEIALLPGIIVEGIYTHLAAADCDQEFTHEQIRRFAYVSAKIDEEGIRTRYRHCANSTGILRFPDSVFNMVRPGLLMYGLYPHPGAETEIDILPVMQVRSRIIFLKRIAEGHTVSYGMTWKAKRDSLVATIPIGYADGYPRMLSNNADVLIHGKRVPVIGRVCMDMIMLDVTEVPEVRVGDTVTIMGQDGTERISAEELAERAQTINYEIVTGWTARLPRVVIKNNR